MILKNSEDQFALYHCADDLKRYSDYKELLEKIQRLRIKGPIRLKVGLVSNLKSIAVIKPNWSKHTDQNENELTANSILDRSSCLLVA